MIRGFTTRREIIKGLPDRWRNTYLRGSGDVEYMRIQRATLARLEVLDLDTATREEVDHAIECGGTGSRGYTELICNGCGKDVEALVTVGEEEEVKSRTVRLCQTCVRDAMFAFEVDGDPIRMRLLVLDRIVALEERYLAAHPQTPALAESGIQQRDDLVREEVLSIARMQALGYGDVESLMVWRVAELRKSGVDAHVMVLKARGSNRWTVAVRLPDGTKEDPSSWLHADTANEQPAAAKDDTENAR